MKSARTTPLFRKRALIEEWVREKCSGPFLRVGTGKKELETTAASSVRRTSLVHDDLRTGGAGCRPGSAFRPFDRVDTAPFRRMVRLAQNPNLGRHCRRMSRRLLRWCTSIFAAFVGPDSSPVLTRFRFGCAERDDRAEALRDAGSSPDVADKVRRAGRTRRRRLRGTHSDVRHRRTGWRRCTSAQRAGTPVS